MDIPHRNGQLRKLRRDAVTRYSSGAAVGGDTDELGEDIAARFRESDKAEWTLTFEHYICTYTEKELAERVAFLEWTADVVRGYGIVVDANNSFHAYTMRLHRKDSK